MELIDMPGLEQRLRKHVESLAATPRVPGTPAHRAAAEYVRQHLVRAGFAVGEDRLADVGFGAPGTNLLTDPRPPRADLPLLVVGAHYDSVRTSPGADDNASAVATLLELASWVGALPLDSPRRRLQLVAYDFEEYGMLGSLHHCQQLRRSGVPLRAMISLEMLGYTDQRPGSQRLPPMVAHLYPDVGNFIGVVGNETSHRVLRTVAEAMKEVNGLPVEFLAVPGNGEIFPETRLSDHSAFWDAGYEALMITDTSFFRNPHYHQASDTAATLDFPFLARVTEGVCRAVATLLEE